MAKRKAGSYMTAGERLSGVIFLLVYMVVLPLAADPFFDLLGKLAGGPLSAGTRSIMTYGVLFLAAVMVFRQALGRACADLSDRLGPACRYLLVGLVGLYGMNELLARLSGLLTDSAVNLNDFTISARIDAPARLGFVVIVLLAPFVEEMLFRGLVFGGLKGKSLPVAYVLSCVLFALSHVWGFAADSQTLTRFLVLVQYLVPGFVLAWSYDRSGTLWTPIALHAVYNALALWT